MVCSSWPCPWTSLTLAARLHFELCKLCDSRAVKKFSKPCAPKPTCHYSNAGLNLRAPGGKSMSCRVAACMCSTEKGNGVHKRPPAGWGERARAKHFWLATSCCCHSTRLSVVCARPRLVYTRRLVAATYMAMHTQTQTHKYTHTHTHTHLCIVYSCI